MEATLKFLLEDPDDKKAHFRCVKATDMACVLFDIKYRIKKELEYAIEANKFRSFNELLDAVYDKINASYEESKIDLDELLD